MHNWPLLWSADGDTYNYHPINITDNGTSLFATILPVNEADVYYVYLKYE